MSGVCSYQVCRWNQTMGPIHMLGGRMGFQRDVSRLQEWTSRNLMKIKIKKCQVWDLGRASWYRLGLDGLRLSSFGAALLRGLAGACRWQGGCESEVCAGCSELQEHLGLYQEQHSQKVCRSDYHLSSALVRLVSGLSFGSPAQCETLANWSEFQLGALILCREAEQAGNFGGLTAAPKYLWGGDENMRVRQLTNMEGG